MYYTKSGMFLTEQTIIKARKPKAWTINHIGSIDSGWDFYDLCVELPNKKYIWLHENYFPGAGHDRWICTNDDKFVGMTYEELLEWQEKSLIKE